MVLRLLTALLVVLATEATAQGTTPPPALNRHGSWVEGRVTGGGREACVAGTPAPGRGSLQATISRTPDGDTFLLLAIRMERVTFGERETVRFAVDGNTVELPGQGGAGGAAVLVAASTDDEARTISDLLIAMQRGRALRILVGNRPALELSLSGASPALAGMRSCAQRAGLMPR